MKKGFIIDLEGTLISSGDKLPGAAEFLRYLVSKNIPFRIITNTVSKSLEDMASTLSKYGGEISPDKFINPLVPLACFLLQNKTNSFYFVGSDYILNNLGIEPQFDEFPEYIVLCDFEYIDCSYELLNKIFTYLNKGSKLLTMSNSEYYLTNNGPRLDTGAFTKMFEEIAGTKALLFGKPSKIIYAEAAKQMSLYPNELIAIGDDVLTDIKGASEFGAYSVLVKSGKYKCGDEKMYKPNNLAESLVDLIDII
ncbi:MAG: HAD-IIA family hydrolase [Bacillota bacterium]|nr:HAD-IIA family hydrolase [Bacillota bacterium]